MASAAIVASSTGLHERSFGISGLRVLVLPSWTLEVLVLFHRRVFGGFLAALEPRAWGRIAFGGPGGSGFCWIARFPKPAYVTPATGATCFLRATGSKPGMKMDDPNP